MNKDHNGSCSLGTDLTFALWCIHIQFIQIVNSLILENYTSTLVFVFHMNVECNIVCRKCNNNESEQIMIDILVACSSPAIVYFVIFYRVIS